MKDHVGIRANGCGTILCVIAFCAQTGVATAAGVQLPILSGGATTIAPNSYPPNLLSYRWPGSYFEGRFTGSSVDLVVQDFNDILQVSVDGAVYALETTVGNADIHLGPFPQGEHLVRMDMLTETYYSPEYFVGFTVPTQANVLPAPQMSPRQIEFIGDSYTVGYGDLSNSVSCPGNTNHTNTTLSFGPLTANHYGADYRINAITGLGVVRNYGGELPGQTMSELYDFTTAGAPWAPQIIAIMLGQNDFSTDLNANEQWPTLTALETDFESTYVGFVEKLRALHPNAYFILMAADATALTQTEVHKVLTLLQAAPYNETRIGYLPINGLSYTGCDYHPNQADHVLIEQDLLGYIGQIPQIWQGAAGTGDFNGDGKSDILWRNSNGDVVIWFMNAGTNTASADLGTVDLSWSSAGTGDFNGDGKSDILWRNANGDVVIWFMNGGTIASSADLGSVPAAWSLAGTGDFNGDGKTDILWRNSNGDTVIWFMNGGTIASSSDLGIIDPVWSIAGTGDFNGDGKADILWRNANGETVIWFMNGGNIASSADFGQLPTTWSIAGTGDFNGDGKADILWRNTSGDTVVWFMNGAVIATTADLGVIPASWTIQGTGDFNGDGKSDILWRNSNGQAVIWFMNGGTLGSSADLGVVPPAWTIVQ